MVENLVSCQLVACRLSPHIILSLRIAKWAQVKIIRHTYMQQRQNTMEQRSNGVDETMCLWRIGKSFNAMELIETLFLFLNSL